MSNPEKEAGTYFRKGNSLYDTKQYGKTIVSYTRVVQRLGDEKAYHNWGNIYYMKGDYQKAMKIYRLAIAIKPYYNMAYNGWGSCLSNLGKYDEAIDKFKKATEADSNYTLAYLNWSLVLFWQDKEAEAEEVLEKGIKHTAMWKGTLIDRYKFELSLVEERLTRAVNEEDKEFLKKRVDGYNWILEMIPKKFARQEMETESESESENIDGDSDVEEVQLQQEENREEGQEGEIE